MDGEKEMLEENEKSPRILLKRLLRRILAKGAANR